MPTLPVFMRPRYPFRMKDSQADCAIAARFHRDVQDVKDLASRHGEAFEAMRSDYDRFYDTPEAARPFLDGAVRAAVDRIERSARTVSEARDGLNARLLAAVVAKGAELGSSRIDPATPAWADVVVDLETIRQWRKAALDGVDSSMASLFLRGPVGRNPMSGMFDDVVKAWCKARGVKPAEVQERILDVAQAGGLPAVIDPEFLSEAEIVRRVELLGEDPVMSAEIEAARAAYPELLGEATALAPGLN